MSGRQSFQKTTPTIGHKMSGRLYQRNGQWYVRTKEEAPKNKKVKKAKKSNAPHQCGSPISGLNVSRLELLRRFLDTILNRDFWVKCLIGSLIGISLGFNIISYYVITELKSQIVEQNQIIRTITK